MDEDTDLTLYEGRELTIPNLSLLWDIAENTAVGKVEKTQFKKKLLFCFENGLPLNLAVNGGLFVINNRVGIESTVIRAQIRKDPHYDYKILRDDNKGATIQILRDGEILGSSTFDENDAKLAGLLVGKDNWEKYPSDMYIARATSRAFKRYCPDIFYFGVYVKGEIQEDPMVIEGEIVPTVTMEDIKQEFSDEDILWAMSESKAESLHEVLEYLREVER